MKMSWFLGLALLSACNASHLVGKDPQSMDMTMVDAADDMATDYSGLDVEPSALTTITVAAGGVTPTVAFNATLLGVPVEVRWSVDRGDIGSMDTGQGNNANFVPRGSTGGLLNVLASVGGVTLKRQVMVKLTTSSQNGVNTALPTEEAQVAPTVVSLKNGGGPGGVGGEGLGVAVSDTATETALATPGSDGTAQHLVWLYPYDATVWPRGMIAPLLMWKWDTNDADAIKIDLSTTSGSFTWSGTFGRPTILGQTAGAFVRHPIPQDVWEMATNSAGGQTPDGKADKLTIKLTVAKSGQAYGPITQTWTIAPARLTGTVYYTAYATQLLINDGADALGHPIGGAILGIRSGDTGPHVAAGKSGSGGCRVCHIVASRGRWMISQSGTTYTHSYVYDLQSANVPNSETSLSPDGIFGMAGMVGTGAFALTDTVDFDSVVGALTQSTSGFFSFATLPPTAVSTSGLPANVGAGYPSFSPDDLHIAYMDSTGQSPTQSNSGPLVIGDYDASTHTFSNLQTIYSPPLGTRIGYPAWLPDSSGLVIHNEIRKSQMDTVIVTRAGSRADLWWVKPGGSPVATRLDALNGKSPNGTPYIPLGPNNHGAGTTTDPGSTYPEAGFDDTTLNYEPTVLPIVTGGYAWVVLTSRRLYGNMLTSPPYRSWNGIGGYDMTDLAQANTKKLWVAAIDLNAPAGSDPSHPAFYLPAQELLSANSRGYWVLDPCQKDGNSCDTGDQCCGGCCQPNGTGGALICQSPPPDGHCSAVGNCSAVQEKCLTSSDCCDSTNTCVNGFCAQVIQ